MEQVIIPIYKDAIGTMREFPIGTITLYTP
jgi:hypothetical protein